MKKPKAANLAKKADEYLSALTAMDRFSGSALVAKDGDVLFCKGYGMANREHDVPNTPQTKFRIASVSKQFTAMAILILQERGALSVHDSICQFVPDCPDAWTVVQIRHLLNHTSGLPNFTNYLDWHKTARIHHTPLQIIEPIRRMPLDFQPGESYSYSNTGYVLLGYIIEQVSNMTFAEFTQKSIFGLLQMVNSGYDFHEEILAGRASGYDRRGDALVNGDFLDMSLAYAAGGLYSTVEDLFLWDQALYTERLVSQRSLEAFFSPTPFVTNYGYGVDNSMLFDRRCVSHSGGIRTFRSHYARYPDDKVCVVALCNLPGSDPWGVTRNLAGMLFGEKVEVPKVRPIVPLPPAQLDTLCGSYELSPDHVIEIERKGTCLSVQLNERAAIELYPESATVFYRKSNDDQVTFEKDKQGKVTGLILKQGGIEAPAKRLP